MRIELKFDIDDELAHAICAKLNTLSSSTIDIKYTQDIVSELFQLQLNKAVGNLDLEDIVLKYYLYKQRKGTQ